MNFPRIWVIPGNRPGDDAQVYALAEQIGLPFETRKLKFNWRAWISGRLMGASAASVNRDLRERTLAPPWPDLVIHVGRRAVPVAQWIRKQSGGRTLLVFVGHPRVPPEAFDLVFTTRQYRTPRGESMRLLPVAMSRYRDRPAAAEAERRWLESLPRPRLLLMLGGSTRYWTLRPAQAAEHAALLADRAERLGGSLIVARSARTSDAVLDSTERRLQSGRCEWRVVRSDFPRFPLLLHDCDELYPTADSISMISEAAIAGKPVGIVPLQKNLLGRFALGRQISDRSTMRDLRRFWTFVLDEQIAGPMEEPVTACVSNPVVEAAREVRALLETRFGKLPA